MQTNRLSAPVQHQKNIVLICNLDPRATAEDVGEACSVFGPILSCDMLLDPMGRPLCEAEIEFLYPDSAERCVSKLDNNYADGRILRAKLQSTPTLPVVPRYSSRTVVASTRVSSNGFGNSMPAPLPPPHVFHQHNRIEYPRRY
ncbi:uncharacterized protein B0P05DRAFT_529925 [Gilbertella persicaria]|uniref:uncharacterized protein n=1 Tax=Gilbertella persicaria TaxID=101096 RepID=UPI002220D2A8|nr:uncharacterized protein B0P05DRAFT_529925 [Gilbertella persicaria]KAI8090229.1 hypothetical protein B0P05DRAFT_529925 [Gilbertella persicaria]